MPEPPGDETNWEERSQDDSEESWMKAHRELEDQWSQRTATQRSRPPLWDEWEWENFFQQMDRDSQPVISYYEKYWNHSDRDRMVEEAVAMYYLREAYRKFYTAPRDEEEFREFIRRETNIQDGGLQGFFDSKENTVYRIPAYRLSRDYYCRLRAWIAEWKGEPPTDSRNLLGFACTCYAKIAGGHILGVHPLTIGGNLALCKRALHYGNRSLEGLVAVCPLDGADVETLHLHDIATEARNAVALRIVDLRNQLYSYLKEG